MIRPSTSGSITMVCTLNSILELPILSCTRKPQKKTVRRIVYTRNGVSG
jgi:hypothetical protein